MFGVFQSLGPLALLGIASAILSTFAFIPYMRDTARRKTQPQRASWLIWSVLSMVAFGSQVYEGATDSLWFAGAQVVGTAIIFLMSLRRGTGGLLNWQDCAIMGMAAGGLLAWYWMETAVYALAITISISMLGGFVTVAKAYRAPQTETYATWALCFLAALCAIGAVGRVDPVLLAYPVYLLVLNGAIMAAITLGRARLRVAWPAE